MAYLAKKLTAAFCLLVWSSTSFARTEGVGWSSLSIEGIRTPIGLTNAVFDDLINVFSTQYKNIELEAVVIYGSRTHHLYGNPPAEDSDLDVVLYTRNLSGMHYWQGQLREWVWEPLVRFRDTVPFSASIRAGKLGIQMAASRISSEGSVSDDEYFDHHVSPHEERKLYEDVGNNRNDFVAARCALQLQKGGAINVRFDRQALILLLKGKSQQLKTIKALRNMGYSNLFVDE